MKTQKLYSPVYCQLRDNDMLAYYDGDYWCDDMPSAESAYYADEINAKIREMDMPEEEVGRGLMAYYREGDAVGEKVRSLTVGVEEYGGQLWGVSTIEVAEDLTPDELNTLRQYISGQYSDGFGESLEQREITIDRGELYVSLWSSEPGFCVMTAEEFAQHLAPEPSPDMTM